MNGTGPAADRTLEYDVVVCGSSLAGSAAAIGYGRAGLRVALLERSSKLDHYKRTCTHEIQASAVPLLRELGVDDALEAVETPRRGVTFHTRYGWVQPQYDDGEEPTDLNWNVRREKIDPIVRRAAADTPGVDLMLGERVVEVVKDGRRVSGVIARERSGRTTEIRAKLVVGADGRESTVATEAGLGTRHQPHGRFVFWGYFKGVELPYGADAHVWLLDPDVAYGLPTDSNLTLLSTMLTKDRLPEYREDPDALFNEVWSSLPDGPPLDGIERVGDFVARIDMTNHRRRTAAPGIALVGDAALCTDPLWGWGCGWALESSRALVAGTAPALKSGSGLDRALLRYQSWHYRHFFGLHKFATGYATGKQFSLVQRILYRAAVRDNELAKDLHLFTTASVGLSGFFGLRTLGRMAREVLTPPGSRPRERQAAGRA
ncbi:MAG TPA: NAD(P)/FAD-dependent oxidoreductase [Thermoleophilaceae bacterium]